MSKILSNTAKTRIEVTATGTHAGRRITLEITEAAMAWLAHEGYDPSFGARPLKRVIQKLISDPAAVMILEAKVAEYADTEHKIEWDKFDWEERY